MGHDADGIDVSRYRAVLFDMDGVLVDSEPHWQRIWREEIFPQVTGDPSLEDVIGRDYTETIPELEARYGLETTVEDLLAEFEGHATGIYAERADGAVGVHELFDEVRDRDLAIGIVSSSPREWIHQVVDRFDLAPLDVVVSASGIDGPGKPKPDVYEHAMADLGVGPEDCVVIEDSENGVRAAASAGATVIRFQYSGDPAPMAGADVVAADPDELRSILLGLLDGDGAV